MKKSDLKTGMRVKIANGDYLLVIKDIESEDYGHQEVAFVDKDGFLIGSNYNEDLLHKEFRECDIDAVFNIDNSGYNLNSKILDLNKRYLIWEREEPKYYLRHRFMRKENDNYFTYGSTDDMYFLTDSEETYNYKTQFTMDEIEKMKIELNTNFEDFEIMEVENE